MSVDRPSCSEPNLQNIPLRTELGKRIHEVAQGWLAEACQPLECDYSELELRLAAAGLCPEVMEQQRHKPVGDLLTPQQRSFLDYLLREGL
jgi:DNA polymerase family A